MGYMKNLYADEYNRRENEVRTRLTDPSLRHSWLAVTTDDIGDAVPVVFGCSTMANDHVFLVMNIEQFCEYSIEKFNEDQFDKILDAIIELGNVLKTTSSPPNGGEVDSEFISMVRSVLEFDSPDSIPALDLLFA